MGTKQDAAPAIGGVDRFLIETMYDLNEAVGVLGGCSGTAPAHIRALAAALQERLARTTR